MVDRDELQRGLSLGRAGLRAPSVAKLRVRAKLGADHAPASAAGASLPQAGSRDMQMFARARRWLTRRPHLTTVGVLMGLSFGAGYWLGRSPEPSPALNAAVVDAPPAGAARAGAELVAGRHPPEAAAAQAKPSSNVALDIVDPGASAAIATSMPAAASVLEPARPATTPRAARVQSVASAGAHPGERPPSAQRSSMLSGTTDDRLAAELALLARTERAIRSGEAALALALLGELDRKFPVPALREEREAARVLARCVSAGAGAEARASAERFIAAHPASVYADRIRESCGLVAVMKRAGHTEEERAAGH